MSEESRIDRVVSEMTLEEKVALCHGNTTFTSSGVPRLGIPDLVMSDGPHGVREDINPDSFASAGRDDDAVTALPAAVCLGATWSRAMARKYGETLGAEARARGKDIILGPGINVARTPLCGRNFEYYSEDPYLISSLVVEEITGIQARGTAACVKHFALNNQELDRNAVDVLVDEQTLREIYLPGFEAAVRKARVLSVMGAYNRFRGTYCCHNDYLLNRILREEWGFRGLVVSDWGGTHSTEEAVRFGLDVEMTGGPKFDSLYLGKAFLDGLKEGRYDESIVDEKARHVLYVMDALGMLNEDAFRPQGAVNTKDHQAAAREIAEEGIVLLKNDDNQLPLNRDGIRTLAVIGENASLRQCYAGGSAEVKALYEVLPLDAIRATLGEEVNVVYAKGYPAVPPGFEQIESACLAPDAAGVHGWQTRYYAGRGPDGEPALTKTEGRVDYSTEESPFTEAPTRFAVTWHSVVTAPETGRYVLALFGSDCVRLSIDGEQVLCLWGSTQKMQGTHEMELQEGQRVEVTATLHGRPTKGACSITFGWIRPSASTAASESGPVAEAVDAARSADAVVYIGGLTHMDDTEGSDRTTIDLPYDQDSLIDAVLAANPNTVIVLYGGAGVAMPWQDRARSIVFAWYPGMEAGNALAGILFGDINPSGKLPVSFPGKLEDCGAHALGEYRAGSVRYDEKLLVGYRYHDHADIDPLFPFGHGLSYTSFEYENLEVTENDTFAVSVDVINTGTRAGKEVVQLYIAHADRPAERPVRELRGFRKVSLVPGERERVKFQLCTRDISWYDVEANAWVCRPGTWNIEVGSSSRDIRLRGRANVHPQT